MENFYNNKVVLVTGGAGSIGSELVRKLIKLNSQVVRILDNNETALFELEQELSSNKVRTLVGDIRDRKRLQRAFEGVDIVFHAAALKHVPLCEFNPSDAVKTNVLGTQNVIDAALDEELEKVVLVSTDKAVNPTNVMGATKLLAERLIVSANNYKGKRKTIFSCVRFGNVLASRGSVLPIFKKQIESGGPVTITDPKMTRFIMSISDAVELILKGATISNGGDIFILKMPALRIVDLAEVMIKELSTKYGYDAKEINLKIAGKRPGEKMYEELMTEDEAKCAVEMDGLYILNHGQSEGSSIFGCNSNNAKMLLKEEIKEIMKAINVI